MNYSDIEAKAACEPFTLVVAERRIKELESKFDFYGETEREKELRREILVLQQQIQRQDEDIRDLLGLFQVLKESIDDVKNDIKLIDDKVEDITSDMIVVQGDIEQIYSDNDLMDDRLSEVESAVDTLDIPDISDLEERVTDLEDAVDTLEDAA